MMIQERKVENYSNTIASHADNFYYANSLAPVYIFILVAKMSAIDKLASWPFH